MKVGDLVKHRTLKNMGLGLIVKVKQHCIANGITASVFWIKHNETILEIPEGLELVNEDR